ncbi:MAG: leucine-rich repeat protein, partial [Muribaculaceae bacterium]|nr:leucine-rich repeat protein [Muribaculaceae bacterium]
WAENYISDVMVIGGTQTEVNNLKTTYVNQGWVVIDKDLNDGCGSSSDYIFLLYKQVGETTPSPFITDFVLTKGSSAPATITYNDCKYHLVKYDGGARFKETKGDLNSNAGGDYIHLYYTTNEDDSRCTAVKSIIFNKTKDGAVVNNNTNEGYDLNSGAGGNYIYMHIDKAQGWISVYNFTSSECYINGFDGPKAGLTYLNVPLAINGAEVLYIAPALNFAEFTNLESLTFHENTVIDWMPMMKNCPKFKHVNTIKNGVVKTDITPPVMKRIPGECFVGTAIEKITLDNIEQIDPSAFKGCANLSEVNTNRTVVIDGDAFAFIPESCRINYSGPSSDWNPMIYKCSPKLVVFAKTDSIYMGWCGATNTASHNTLYWTIGNDKHLKINSYVNLAQYSTEQLITNHGWTTRESATAVKDVKQLTLEHVDTIAESEFLGYKSLKVVDIKSGARIIGNLAFESCDSLSRVNLPSSLSTIRIYAFRNCSRLADVYFDGTQLQWDNVNKEEYWDSYMPEGFKAHWHCTVTFENNGHGTAPEPQYIEWSNQDKAQEPTAPTETGYTFIGWFTDTNLYTQWNFSRDIVPGDMILYAKWMKRGDINADEKVDVSDVNIVINLMLGKAQVNAFPGTADLNNDNKVDVTDVNIVINIMLGKVN